MGNQLQQNLLGKDCQFIIDLDETLKYFTNQIRLGSTEEHQVLQEENP